MSINQFQLITFIILFLGNLNYAMEEPSTTKSSSKNLSPQESLSSIIPPQQTPHKVSPRNFNILEKIDSPRKSSSVKKYDLYDVKGNKKDFPDQDIFHDNFFRNRDKFTYEMMQKLTENNLYAGEDKTYSKALLDRKNGRIYNFESHGNLSIKESDSYLPLTDYFRKLKHYRSSEFYAYILFDSNKVKKGVFWVTKANFKIDSLPKKETKENLEIFRLGFKTKIMNCYLKNQFTYTIKDLIPLQEEFAADISHQQRQSETNLSQVLPPLSISNKESSPRADLNPENNKMSPRYPSSKKSTPRDTNENISTSPPSITKKYESHSKLNIVEVRVPPHVKSLSLTFNLCPTYSLSSQSLSFEADDINSKYKNLNDKTVEEIFEELLSPRGTKTAVEKPSEPTQ